MRPTLAVLLSLMLVSACAGRRDGAVARAGNVITAAEIEQHRRAGVRDVLELIERARPRWLQVRLERSLQLETTLLVYVNETRLGRTDALRNYPLDQISSIKYLDAAAAGLLPGAGSAHVEGAIVISTAIR